MFESSTYLPLTSVDSEREYTYDLSENLNRQLDEMGTQLNEIIQELGKGDGNESNDLDAIVKILGQHLSSLQWLDGSVNTMSVSVIDLEKKADSIRLR